MDEIVSGPLPVFASVIVCAGLVVETVREANVSEPGVSEITGAGATPVPPSRTLCGLPAALVATESEPIRVPALVGENVTLIVQVPPGAIDVGHTEACVKSPVAVIE